MVVQAAAPVEQKVKAATAGAGTGAAVAAVLVWALDRYAFSSSGGTPEVVRTAVYALVLTGLPAVASFAAGYQARHTARLAPAVALLPPPGEAEAAAERLHRDSPPT